jgi:tetratricopeptide (TPR) repeat protein
MKPASLLIILLSCTISLLAQNKEKVLLLTERLMDERKYDSCLMVLNKVIKAETSEALYYSYRGAVQMERKKFKEAHDDFSKAISLDPHNPYYYSSLSLLFYTTQNPEEAIEQANRALEHVGANDTLKYSIINNRANARNMKRDFQGAYYDYMEVLTFDSTSLLALNNLGTVLDELGRPDEATAVLEKVVRLYPNFVGGYGNLAFRYGAKGEYQKALELNNKVLELDPDEALGWNNRGYVKFRLNDMEGALADINKSIQLYPTNSYAFRNRALVYLAQKKTKKACEDLQKAIDYGFTEMYGEEVEELKKKYCGK